MLLHRTDQTAYGIFKNGVCVKTVPDLLDIPFDDFLTFYLGCSHSFELALATAGLPVRHQQVDRSVPSYKTKIPCLPEGPFWANLVASMRPMPRDLVQRAVEATAVLEQVHGAPVHIGHPCWIGVKDLMHPEYDDEPNIQEGDVCLFWGCGTTAQEALANASKFHLVAETTSFHLQYRAQTVICCKTLSKLKPSTALVFCSCKRNELPTKRNFLSQSADLPS